MVFFLIPRFRLSSLACVPQSCLRPVQIDAARRLECVRSPDHVRVDRPSMLAPPYLLLGNCSIACFRNAVPGEAAYLNVRSFRRHEHTSSPIIFWLSVLISSQLQTVLCRSDRKLAHRSPRHFLRGSGRAVTFLIITSRSVISDGSCRETYPACRPPRFKPLPPIPPPYPKPSPKPPFLRFGAFPIEAIAGSWGCGSTLGSVPAGQTSTYPNHDSRGAIPAGLTHPFSRPSRATTSN